MAWGLLSGLLDFSDRLWLLILGGATSPIGNSRRCSRYHPGIHHVVGNPYSADPASHSAPRGRAAHWDRRYGSADESLVLAGRSSTGSRWRSGPAFGRVELV